MRLGYSFWGFLGDGIVNTPDGGRSHRPTLVKELKKNGFQLVFLQQNRDLLEANQNFQQDYEWDETGLPPVDAIFFEWRWKIEGRNFGVSTTSASYTPDLDRQNELIRNYSEKGIPTIVWDKDQTLSEDDPIRKLENVTVCEPAFFPRQGCRQLLFPVPMSFDTQWPLSRNRDRSCDLIYVGNQYGRDEAFDEYFAKPAIELSHQVLGKWTERQRWPHVRFIGRCGFDETKHAYDDALATVLLAPPRYAERGQITQRLFEAVERGCVPIGTCEVKGIDKLLPAPLIANNGADVRRIVSELRALSREEIDSLFQQVLKGMSVFRVDEQVKVIKKALSTAS